MVFTAISYHYLIIVFTSQISDLTMKYKFYHIIVNIPMITDYQLT